MRKCNEKIRINEMFEHQIWMLSGKLYIRNGFDHTAGQFKWNFYCLKRTKFSIFYADKDHLES